MLLNEFVKDLGIKKYFKTPKNIKYALLANFIQLVLEGEWIGELDIEKDFSLNPDIMEYFSVLDTNIDTPKFGDVYIILADRRYRYGVLIDDKTVIEQPNNLTTQHVIMNDDIVKLTNAVKLKGNKVVWLRPLNQKNIIPALQYDPLQFVDVNDFGAVGDGETDDTDAINAAITYASTNATGIVMFSKTRTYIVRTLVPKNNVTMELNGSTLKLKDNVESRMFYSAGGGHNFSVNNGIIDGNQANNIYDSYDFSSAFRLTGWRFLKFTNLEFKEVYSKIFWFGNSTDVVIDNIYVHDCGTPNPYNIFAYALDLNNNCKRFTVSNFKTINHYGFGYHFYTATDITVNNVLFDTLNYLGDVSIAITFTKADNVTVSNVTCNKVVGSNLEFNSSTNITVENANIKNAGVGGVPLIFGDNFYGISNERLHLKNIKVTNTEHASSSLRINYVKNSIFENLEIDKNVSLTVATQPSDRDILWINCKIAQNATNALIFGKKHNHINTKYNDITVNRANLGEVVVSNSGDYVSIADGTSTDVSLFGILGIEISARGNQMGKLKVSSWFNNAQCTYKEYPFVMISTGNIYLGDELTVNGSTARPLTISTNGADRKFVLTNNTGVELRAKWTVEMMGV